MPNRRTQNGLGHVLAAEHRRVLCVYYGPHRVPDLLPLGIAVDEVLQFVD